MDDTVKLKRDLINMLSKTNPDPIARTKGSYYSMLTRCYNTKHNSYASYGAKGIAVCDAWRNSFEAFKTDMGLRPPNMTLDRFPNANGNYEPGNCRWATNEQQNRNKRQRKAKP